MPPSPRTFSSYRSQQAYRPTNLNNRWNYDPSSESRNPRPHYNYANPVNEKGFHGFKVPSTLIERTLFGINELTSGINFDKV